MNLADRVRGVMESGRNAVVSFDEGAVAAGTAAAPDGSLAGVSLAVKDNICTLDLPTTCASRILAGYQSPFQATAVARARAAGAVVACKTNMDEFGMGSSTEHSAYGPCRHPTHPDHVPGGSSGGSAVIVALGGADVALGSDTGGSVRQPAAFCGVVGYKPSYGRVSRYGLVAFGSSLDQIGVLARKVDEAARVTAVISGQDPYDATSHGGPVTADLGSVTLAGKKIGVPTEYFPSDLNPDVSAACERVKEILVRAGAELFPVTLSHTDLAVAAYYVIAPAEASANLARFDGVRYGARSEDAGTFAALIENSRGQGFGPEVQRRILVGTYVLSAGYADAFYRQAQSTRAVVADDFTKAFSDVDLLFTPTTPEPAFRIAERIADPVAMYQGDRFVVAANLAGVPAISVPIGHTAHGLPIGGQLMAPVGGDELLLGAARRLEYALEDAA